MNIVQFIFALKHLPVFFFLLVQMPEEEAFAVYVSLMYEYKIRDLFKPNMYELGLCMFKLECMLQVRASVRFRPSDSVSSEGLDHAERPPT